MKFRFKHSGLLFFAGLALFASCSSSDGDSNVAGDTQDGVVDSFEDSCELIKGGFGPGGQTALFVETLVTGLEVPWAIAFLDNQNFLVTERNGNVRIVRNQILNPTPVAVIEDARDSRSEGGLLGLAIDPNFSANRHFYVYYTGTNNSGDEVNRVDRYRISDDFTSSTFDRRMLDNIPASARHDGGRIKFGPDGNLYVGTGDATSPNLSQDPNSFAGKILRLDRDGRASIAITGVRNVQGFDWLDASTLVIADHGPSGEMGRRGHDELTFARTGDNLGWPNTWRCDQSSGIRRPVLVWEQALPPGGLVIAKNSRVPEWDGSALITSLGSEHLQRVAIEITPDGVARQVANEVYLRGTYGRLREIVQAPDGSFLVTTSNCDGRGSCGPERDRILRITKD